MNKKLKDSMINVYDLQKKISVLSPVNAQPSQEIDFTPKPNLNVSAMLKEAAATKNND